MVDSQVSQHPWALARFYLNPTGDSFLGYHKGQKWNGFAVPYFEKQEATKVAASVVVSGESYVGHYFNEKSDQFILIPHGVPCYAGEPTNGEDITVEHGRNVRVYGIGAGGWTWGIGPALCESCPNVFLTPDFQCPKCNVSHSGAQCDQCGRFGYHRDDCSELDGEPGSHTVPKPDYATTPEARRAEVLELAKTFERAYQYYNGWGFSYEHPGVFSYYKLGGDLTVCFTPDWSDEGVVDVQVQGDKGDSFEQEGNDHSFVADRSAPALFRIVKPYLDRLAGKSAADLKTESK